MDQAEELELEGVGHSPQPHLMDSYKTSLKVSPSSLRLFEAKVWSHSMRPSNMLYS